MARPLRWGGGFLTLAADFRQRFLTLTGMTVTQVYNDADRLLRESYTGGPLNGMAVTNAYDALLRRTAVALDVQPGTLVNYAYDNASRLSVVTSGTRTATYSYLANSPLVGQITFRNSGPAVSMTTVRQYDLLNRLTSISNASTLAGVAPLTYAYTYNNANQRVRVDLADGSYWRYEYDALGQVISGKRYWPDGSPVAGQQFEYGFDDIGNREVARSGGDENGWNLRSASYSANSVNQYTQREVPGYVDVMGISFATNTVTVNSQGTYRKGEYFRAELSVNNGSAPVWQSVAVQTNGVTGVSGNVFVPKTPEVFWYDADGNLTNDGRWVYTWDAENRLVKVESVGTSPAASKRKVEWVYDPRGRRIQQTTYDLSSGSAVATENLKFVYDGWKCLAELNATNNALVRHYAWGLDLSGTMDEAGLPRQSTATAGGVGGLLWMRSGPAVYFCQYDGNGNVVGLVQGNGAQVAVYEYDPFGRTLRATGSQAKNNPFRFSTKRANDTTDFVLYGYRVYDPNAARWPNRDPIGEIGGFNLYGMVDNDPVNLVDPAGLHPEPHDDHVSGKLQHTDISLNSILPLGDFNSPVT